MNLMVYLPPSLQRQSSASGHAGPSWILSEREQTSLICASALVIRSQALAQLIPVLGLMVAQEWTSTSTRLGAGPGNEASDPLMDCRSPVAPPPQKLIFVSTNF